MWCLFVLVSVAKLCVVVCLTVAVMQSFDHLSWLGLYKDLSLQLFWNKTSPPHKSTQQLKDLMEEVEQLGLVSSQFIS